MHNYSFRVIFTYNALTFFLNIKRHFPRCMNKFFWNISQFWNIKPMRNANSLKSNGRIQRKRNLWTSQPTVFVTTSLYLTLQWDIFSLRRWTVDASTVLSDESHGVKSSMSEVLVKGGRLIDRERSRMNTRKIDWINLVGERSERGDLSNRCLTDASRGSLQLPVTHRNIPMRLPIESD